MFTTMNFGKFIARHRLESLLNDNNIAIQFSHDDDLILDFLNAGNADFQKCLK